MLTSLFDAQSPDAVVAHFCALAIVFPCCSHLSLAQLSHARAERRALTSASQHSSQVTAYFIVHPCSRIVEQIFDVPVPQNSGTYCHQINTQRHLHIKDTFDLWLPKLEQHDFDALTDMGSWCQTQLISIVPVLRIGPRKEPWRETLCNTAFSANVGERACGTHRCLDKDFVWFVVNCQAIGLDCCVVTSQQARSEKMFRSLSPPPRYVGNVMSALTPACIFARLGGGETAAGPSERAEVKLRYEWG